MASRNRNRSRNSDATQTEEVMNQDQTENQETTETTVSPLVASLKERIEAAQATKEAEEAALNIEIEKREQELDELYALRGYGREGQKRGRRIAAKREGGNRIDWDEKLRTLPKVFSVDDMLKDSDIAAKGKVQCYPAVQRWIKNNKVKALDRGKWRKLAA